MKTKYLFLWFLISASFFTAKAQQKLIFSNANSGKVVVVKQHDMVKLAYNGYLGQIQSAYGRVEWITDSVVSFQDGWQVRINDIIGFRKFIKYRDILQSTTTIVTLIGGMILVPYVIYNNPGMSDLQRMGVLFGIGAGVSAINNLLFPDNIKYYMRSGWTVKAE